MRSRVQSTTAESGVSILAVLVAMILLSVGIVALSSAGVYVLGVETEASARSTAISIGVAYMEKVKRRDPSTLATESPVRVNETGELDPGGRFTRAFTVSSAAGVLDAKRVMVQVGYPAGRGRTGAVALETVIYIGNV